MNKDAILLRAEEYARHIMKDYDPGHDWWHVQRVRKLSAHINSEENTLADEFILDIAAILHDTFDSKFKKSGDQAQLKTFLKDNGLQDISCQVTDAITNISFSNKSPSGNLSDPLYLILQDADRLDAIGAIGIARVFSYGSRINDPIYYPPDLEGVMPSSSIKHFYDKLLRLKDLMNTNTGKKLAEEKHQFLEKFLEQFFKEWEI